MAKIIPTVSKIVSQTTFCRFSKCDQETIVHLENSSQHYPLEGDVVPHMNKTARWRGCGWMEVPCHETVILTAIKLTSIHYWKWLPTLQTHLGECAVIREFVGEGPECLTTTLSTTVRETEIYREMWASVALMLCEVGLMDIKGKQDRMEGLGCLSEARRTLEVTTLSPDERKPKTITMTLMQWVR